MSKKVARMTNNISGVFIFEDAFYNQNKKQVDDYFTKAKDSLICQLPRTKVRGL